jgi:O-antigen/teichoic acid export membrane protein
MSPTFKVAGNTLAQIIAKVITSAATFIITIIIARQYGAIGYGDFTKIFSYVVVYYLLADFGLNAVYLRQSESQGKTLHIASLLIIRTFLSTILVFIALAVLAFLPYNSLTNDGFSPLVKIGIIILLPTIITSSIQTSVNALFQKHLRYDKAAIASILGSITTISVVLLLTRINAPVSIIITGYLAGGVVTAVSGYLISRSLTSWKSIDWKKQLTYGKSIFLSSVPLGLTLVFNVIDFKADVFILTLYRTTQEVGIFGLAAKFFEFALTIPTFFMNAVYPLLLINIANQEKTQRMVKKSAISLGIISLVVLTAGILAAPLLPSIKEDFSESIPLFKTLMVILPLFFISPVLMWYLIAKDKAWQLVWVYAVGMIVNVVLNIIAIPRYGAMAAVVITGVSEAIMVLLLAYYAYPLLRLSARKK